MTTESFRFIFSLMGQMKRQERYYAEEWAKANRHLVLMAFDRRGPGWRITFRDQPTNARLPRVITFTNADKIRDLHRRFGARRMSEDVAAFEFALTHGRGLVELRLGDEQYAKLQNQKAPPRKVGP